MITDIRELAENPVVVLEAMLDGLEKMDNRENFVIDMYTFGNIDGDVDGNPICFGCAATATLQQITGITIDVDNDSIDRRDDRAERYNIHIDSLSRIEDAVNMARRGCFNELFNLFGYGMYKNGEETIYDDPKMHMENNNWREKVPAFRKVIARMRENNPGWS